MATQDSTDQYYWQATAALDILLREAQPIHIIQASELLDGGNTAAGMLRGLSYITRLVCAEPEGPVFDAGRTNALETVSAFTELYIAS